MSRAGFVVAVVCLLAPALPAQAGEQAELGLTLTSLEATVGDPLEAKLTVTLGAGQTLEPARVGPELGSFRVDSGSWSGPLEGPAGVVWTWSGTLRAFRTGELELPPIRVRIDGPGDASSTLASEALTVTIGSVLSDEDRAAEQPEIADLKPPASIAPRLGPLWAALGILAALLAGAALLWWLSRRYGRRLAAAAVPDDPFHRTPPHVWVYGELQKLLERRLPEQGQVVLFYAELARILKRYLGGRFRIDLLERTSEEVPDLLRQAGAAVKPTEETRTVLSDSDQVKFARVEPGSDRWREAVERVYRIVDTTKPADAAADPQRGAA